MEKLLKLKFLNSDKNLKVEKPDDSEKWNLDEVKKYFIENEIYIQFYGYYRRTNIVKKSRFFISEVKEVKDRDGKVQENEFVLYARLLKYL